MSKARNIADLLDANGDVKSANLDNVPPSNDASALTTGTLPIARLADGSVTAAKLENSAKTVKGTTPPSSPEAGDTWYDTTNRIMKFYDSGDSQWKKISSELAVLSSVSGSIIAGASSTLTLTGTGFLSDTCIVNFLQASDAIDVDVSVTASSDTSISVTVPSTVYSNVTSGNLVSITVTNSDTNTSAAKTNTAVALPSGGTITTSGDYRIHTFTSSGTFTNTIPSLSAEYLVIAGGGGGGTRHGGGGGAGGYRTNVSGATSGGGASAESAITLSAQSYSITVGGGGSGNGDPNNQQGTGYKGSNSVFSTITSLGGGGGGGRYFTGNTSLLNGGSGGGANTDDATGTRRNGGTGTSGQGYNGGKSWTNHVANYTSGGGGGAGAVGQDAPSTATAGAGGNGVSSSITGTATTRAGGGGGGTYTAGSGGAGGSGGGARGADGAENGDNATANTGSGGGGGGNLASGGNGGSGIVIVRYDLTSI